MQLWKWSVIAAAVAAAVLTVTAAWHAMRPPAIATLVRAADAGPVRLAEGRLTGGFAYRPFAVARGRAVEDNDWRLLAAAAEVRDRALKARTPVNLRSAAVAALVIGHGSEATQLAEQALAADTGEGQLLPAIRRSRDGRLLTDLAAVEYGRVGDDAAPLLVAIEAADRAWRLDRQPEAAWNRALAIERLGITGAALHAWRDYLAVEPSAEWRHEAAQHVERLTRRLSERMDESLDAERLFAGASMRKENGFTAYARGCDAMARGEVANAREAFAVSEQQLAARSCTFVYAARYQRIRCECTEGSPDCLPDARSLENELRREHLFPGLAARIAGVEGQSLWNGGKIYDAVTRFESALGELERLHDAAGAAWIHTLLANALATAGESDLALEHHVAALRAYGAPNDDRSIHVFESAAFSFLRRDALSAAGVLVTALHDAPQNDSRVMELSLAGVLRMREHDPAAAAAAFSSARALLARLGAGDRDRVSAFVDSLEAGSRRYAAAAMRPEELTPTIGRYEATADLVWLPQLLLERGAAYEREGRFAEAEADYGRAMTLIEQRQPRIDGLLIGAELTAEGESAFDRAIRLMLREERIAAALAIADRANAQHISAVFAVSGGFRDAYRAAAPARRHSISEAQRLLRDDQRLVAGYLLHDALITWVVSRDRIDAFRRPLNATRLTAEVAALRSPSGGGSVSAAMLSPWIANVPRGSTLIFVPPSALGAVPYAMLSGGSQPLIETHPIAVVTSMSEFIDAVRSDSERHAPATVLFASAGRGANGLEPLPKARLETSAAAANYRNPVLLPDATRDTFLSDAGAASVVHFAGHALVNDRQPLLSALVFRGGYLYVHEISARSFAHARLVVLSACSTGRSPRPTMSIATALLRQGVPSVVYTLWDVSDGAAADFAELFHRSLGAGRSRAEAVREAQREMRRRGSSEWPAFQLAGVPDAFEQKEREDRHG